MEKEHLFGAMEINMKENGRTMIKMEKELFILAMEINMKEIEKMV